MVVDSVSDGFIGPEDLVREIDEYFCDEVTDDDDDRNKNNSDFKNVPDVLVLFNKIDLLEKNKSLVDVRENFEEKLLNFKWRNKKISSVKISCLTNDGIEEFLKSFVQLIGQM